MPSTAAAAATTADSYDIVAALDRLVARGVTVANLSFTGPANALVERGRRRCNKRGMLIVAAAGNDGPSSPPRYPAAYDWAVAVTAVDRRDNVYARAVRGPHIDFAAPGVRVQLPDRAMRPGPLRSGTSYAAPTRDGCAVEPPCATQGVSTTWWPRSQPR